ncbi:MAG: competence/damage-inducible protein A [Bacillota bacterium]|nr:competence/damage-inducible protein A [Bacillota bacterium]
MKATILTIGNELLSGKTLNTNSQFLSMQLNSLGFEVVKHITIEDDEVNIIRIIDELANDVDLIVTTGGLGPTYDDITVSSIAKSLECEMIFFENVMKDIKEKFSKYNSKMGQNNISQAYFPKESIILKNRYGTAAGMYLEHEKVCVVSLPGPPNENIPMFNEFVVPLLEKMGNGKINIKDIVLFGVGESNVEEILNKELQYDGTIRIATYIKPRYVIIRLTSKDHCTIEKYSKLIIKIFDKNIVGFDGMNLEKNVVELLKNRHFHLSLAESCTGGMISSMIVNVPGSSEVLERSIVTYSNKAKVDELNVSTQSIETHGAVSEVVAREMVEGLYNKTKSDICVSITGIAGPDGGSKDKPVGLAYIAIKSSKDTVVEKYIFFGDRNNIRHKAALCVLNLIRLEFFE